jgi:hypothetical protein
MLCQHLAQLEQELLAANIPVTFRGQAWSSNCREWVYFACWLDRQSIRSRIVFPEFVKDHVHRGTHDGQESGLVCAQCNDAVMGLYSSDQSEGSGKFPIFR